MEKQNSQCEHGQSVEQTRGLFCMCNSGVACCQSQKNPTLSYSRKPEKMLVSAVNLGRVGLP